jgi:hypothetical protein
MTFGRPSAQMSLPACSPRHGSPLRTPGHTTEQRGPAPRFDCGVRLGPLLLRLLALAKSQTPAAGDCQMKLPTELRRQ